MTNTTVKQEIQLDMLDEGMSVNNTIKIKEKKPVCNTKKKLSAAKDTIRKMEQERLGMLLFLQEVGYYEAWVDNKSRYVKEGK